MKSFSVSGNIVDIIQERIYPGKVTVNDGKISEIIEEKGVKYNTYILPGFIDAHIHIESSMLVPTEFARIASVHGTVATVSDPHEIANVLGVQGVKFMSENASKTPFKFNFGVPSCVPATDFETSGEKISVDEIDSLLKKPEYKYLSEMMNFPGVIFEEDNVSSKLNIAKKYGKKIDGHAPGLRGDTIRKYAEAGISTDHECFALDEAEEKINLGMKVLIREGSAAKNFDVLHPLLKKYNDMVMFCSDDKHPDDLILGHINEIVKKAVNLGYGIFGVLRAACLNPIRHYDLDVGLLQTGDNADFIVVNNLKDFNVLKTYIDGFLMAENHQSNLNYIESDTPNKFNVEKKNIDDFVVKSEDLPIRVIQVMEGQLITNEILAEEKIKDGIISTDIEHDILKIAVVNRYEDAKPSVGFINDIGLKRGALATSVAHDSHNIIVVGCDDKSLCDAVNLIIENKGGMAVVSEDFQDILPLPVAGLMSADNCYKVAEKYSILNNKARDLGTYLNAPFMTLSFMTLLVIPKLKLSDKGLFDGEKFEFVDLHIKE